MLAAAGDRFSQDLRRMVRQLGVEQRHSILSNYSRILMEDAEPEWDVHGTELAVRAARDCLERASCPASGLGLVIAVTNTPSRHVPGMASDLFAQMPELPRGALNLSLQGQGCAPLLKALEATRWWLGSDDDAHALIVCMESTTAMSPPLTAPKYGSFTEASTPSELQDTVDVLHGFLFADAAVALLITGDGDGPVFGPITHLTNDDPSDAELGNIIGAGTDSPYIQGRPVYQLRPGIRTRGAHYAAETVARLLDHPDCPITAPAEAVQTLVHTGSRYILEDIRERFELDEAQLASSYQVLSRYGNVTGASLGFMLADALEAASGQCLLMAAFGLGFSASAGILSVP
jgi:3-oxoacyl-[acyl-carrier-protein] synthase III